MGGGLPNLRGKTGRNPLDSLNREKRIHENPSHFNLAPDFIGSISKNRVFQRELNIGFGSRVTESFREESF